MPEDILGILFFKTLYLNTQSHGILKVLPCNPVTMKARKQNMYMVKLVSLLKQDTDDP